MDDAVVWYGYVTVANASQIQITSGSLAQNYYGSFSYGNNDLSGGTVTSSEFYRNGVKIWDVTGGPYNALTVESYINSGNILGLQAYVLSASDRLNGSNDGDILDGNANNDQIYGNNGNDKLRGGSGNDYLDGGNGTDTALYSNVRSLYTVTKTLSGYDVSGPDGSDTLINIERLKFTDKTIALDIDGTAGQAYRLYQAAFDRQPDSSGLGYWINDMDNGSSLTTVAAGFFQSPEFQALYGSNPSTTTLITNFYQNVLHRAPDQAGFDYWAGELNSGKITPAGALASFCESTENQAQVIGSIQNGIEYTSWLG